MKSGTNHKKASEAHRKRANQRMRTEVSPLLTSRLPRLSTWNPLQATDISDYGLELKLSTTGADAWREIMASDKLFLMVKDIVIETVATAAIEESKDFVTDLLSSLMSDG
jgi:hypothetical protein